VLEATFWNVADFRLMPDFGNGTTTLYDAYVDLRPFSWLKLRAGKFKPPVGLERLQSATAIVFPERALPTQLVPNRDVGFQLHGALADSLLTYELGVFNGTIDGSSSDLDNNHAKDFAGRLFVRPFSYDPYNFFANLGVGIAGSTGKQNGAPATFQTQATGAPRRLTVSTPALPTYKTAGQNIFFSYLLNDDVPDATVFAKGRHSRLSPQGYFYYDRFGVLGEYVVSTQTVWKGASTADLTHTSWQIYGEAVLGGKPTFEGVGVAEPFDPAKGQWGALELAARYNELKIDADTFPTYADPTKSASRARAAGGVVTWHWSKNIKLVFSFEHTSFKGGAKGGNHTPENVLFQRVQGAF
jgi:phosphate-selective porin OprO/OprP